MGGEKRILRQSKILFDTSQIMGRGYPAAIQIAVELLAIDADAATGLGNGAGLGAKPAQVL